MNGRLFSVLALSASLALLVLVATFADAVASPPVDPVMKAAVKRSPAAWTHFTVRPVVVLAAGGLREAPPAQVEQRPALVTDRPVLERSPLRRVAHIRLILAKLHD